MADRLINNNLAPDEHPEAHASPDVQKALNSIQAFEDLACVEKKRCTVKGMNQKYTTLMIAATDDFLDLTTKNYIK